VFFHGARLTDFERNGHRTYVAEPAMPQRRWTTKAVVLRPEKAAERAAVPANRRRIRGARGKRLIRKRAEVVERTIAPTLTTGGMRRTWLRGLANVAKRYQIQDSSRGVQPRLGDACGGGNRQASGLAGLVCRVIAWFYALHSQRDRMFAACRCPNRRAEQIAP